MPSIPTAIASTYATKGHRTPIQIVLRLSVSEHHCHLCQKKGKAVRDHAWPPRTTREFEDDENVRITCQTESIGGEDKNRSVPCSS